MRRCNCWFVCPEESHQRYMVSTVNVCLSDFLAIEHCVSRTSLNQTCTVTCLAVFFYPVVRRELRSYGYSYSLLNGELRSYQEFPNHILDFGLIRMLMDCDHQRCNVAILILKVSFCGCFTLNPNAGVLGLTMSDGSRNATNPKHFVGSKWYSLQPGFQNKQH